MRTAYSTKKPIFVRRILFRQFLKELTLLQLISCCARLFQRSTVCSEKKYRLRSRWQWCFAILAEWPLVLVAVLSEKSTVPCTFWKPPAGLHDYVIPLMSISPNGWLVIDWSHSWMWLNGGLWLLLNTNRKPYPKNSMVFNFRCFLLFPFRMAFLISLCSCLLHS